MKTPSTGKRRVIFNCDSNAAFGDTEQSGASDIGNYVAKVFAGLENSHVDALFWMDGAGGNTANYDSAVLELTGQRINRVSGQLRRWIDEGNDPPKVVVGEAKKRGLDVFFSFRINDVHDAFGAKAELPTFKVEHPEWTIGEGHENCAHTALNFAVAEVRDLKFATVKEIFDKYDFDGIEIDFMRGPPFFIPGQEPDHAHILTDWLRNVRSHLDERAKQRGRAIEVAAHVDENLEACRLDGFEVGTWMQEGLIDILTLGSGAMDMEVEGFKKLAEPSGVLIYPCVYGWPSGYRFVQFDGRGGQGGLPPELARALAANYWHQGADGIYTFNWFPHQEHLSYQIDLLRQIGDPRSLRGKDKLYAADRGGPSMCYPHNWLRAPLLATVEPGRQTAVGVMVGEDLSESPVPQRIELQIECEPPPNVAMFRAELNGRPLPPAGAAGSRLTIPLRPEQTRPGRNEVTMTTANGSTEIKALEIHVGY